MSAKPDLSIITSEPVAEDVISTLEQTLELARAGEISAVTVVTVSRDGCMGSGWSKLHSYAAMIGALERAKYTIMRSIDE